MEPSTTTVQGVSRRFLDATDVHAVNPDLASLFAPTVAVAHNFDDAARLVPGPALAAVLLGEIVALRRALPDFRREDERVIVGTDAFAVSRTTRGTLPDGAQLRFTQCVVSVVTDGLISRLDTYYDRQQVAPLLALLAASRDADQVAMASSSG
jgi:hypothetical protein